MMISMQDAMKSYFKKLEKVYQEKLKTRPSVCYTEDLNKSLLISKPDEDGEVEWKLVRQEPFDWTSTEQRLGFSLSEELRDFYNTFWYLEMSGAFGNCRLHFYENDGRRTPGDVALQQFKDGRHTFPDQQCFLIGSASVSGDDNYFIFCDNSSGKLFCYDDETKNQILLSYSIAGIISKMEALI